MDEQKIVAKGAFLALLSQFAIKFLAFIYLVIIARFLPADVIGLFYLGLSIFGILYIFTDLGLMAALNRYVPFFYAKEQFENLRRLIKFSYLGGCGLTLLFSLLVFLFAQQISDFLSQPLLTPIFRILSIWLLLQEIFDISRGILNGMKKIKDTQVLELSLSALRFIFTIAAFFLIGFTINTLVIPYVLAFFIISLIALKYTLKEIRQYPTAPGKSVLSYPDLAKEIVSFGFVNMLITTFWTLAQYVDRVMLNYILPNALFDIGVYSIAVGLASLILLFPSAIAVIFLPLISELYGKEKYQRIRVTTDISIKWLIIITFPITMIIIVFSQELLQLFYGQTYIAGYGVLILFSLGFFARSLSMLPGLVIASMRRLDVELLTAIIAMILNIILNLILIPPFGINGAALASAISFFAVSVMLFYFGKKLFNLSIPLSSVRPLIAGIIAISILFLIKPLVVSIFFSVNLSFIELSGLAEILAQKLIRLLIFGLLFILTSLLYFAILSLFKAFGQDEVTILQSALRRAKIPEKYINYTNWLMNYNS